MAVKAMPTTPSDTEFGEGGFWVFAYGSLLWNAGFKIAERRRAKLSGFRRAFCMWSWHHRGTPESPGLVLALDRNDGESCEGLALRVAPEDAEVSLAELRRRELVSFAYKEEVVTVELDDGRNIEAIAYVVDPGHEQYCGKLDAGQQARTISNAAGGRGPNSEYLANTVAAFRELGIRDRDLEALDAAVNGKS